MGKIISFEKFKKSSDEMKRKILTYENTINLMDKELSEKEMVINAKGREVSLLKETVEKLELTVSALGREVSTLKYDTAAVFKYTLIILYKEIEYNPYGEDYWNEKHDIWLSCTSVEHCMDIYHKVKTMFSDGSFISIDNYIIIPHTSFITEHGILNLHNSFGDYLKNK